MVEFNADRTEATVFIRIAHASILKPRAAIIFALNHFITGDRSSQRAFPIDAYAKDMAVISWTAQTISAQMDAYRNHCLLNAPHLPTP